MKFPKIINHRKTEVTIYGKTSTYPFYRVAFRVDGNRRQKSFSTYLHAKEEAEKIAKSVSSGSPVTALSSIEARDAIAALQRCRQLKENTGRSVSLLTAARNLPTPVRSLAAKRG